MWSPETGTYRPQIHFAYMRLPLSRMMSRLKKEIFRPVIVCSGHLAFTDSFLSIFQVHTLDRSTLSLTMSQKTTVQCDFRP